MRRWTRSAETQMPVSQRHIVTVDARKNPELAALLWQAEYGGKSELMVSLMEAGRRQVFRDQASKRGAKSSPTVSGLPPSVAEQQVQPEPPPQKQAALAPAPSPPVLPEQASNPPQATEPSETPPDLGVLKGFLV